MIKYDFHLHTDFCDGANTPEEMVKQAIEQNLESLGITCHAYTPFDPRYCIKPEKIQLFINEVARLKEEYKDKINISCGVEYDIYSEIDVTKFDYVIGSVHYVKKDGEYFEIDESKLDFITIVKEKYNGDVYALIEDYYDTVGKLCLNITPTFIAHLDLISKFNKDGDLFDENNDRYVNAWKKAVDTLMEHVTVFEINTGAMSRGYQDRPYPSESQIEYIKSKGGSFILSSDAHSIYNLAYKFNEFEKYLDK